MKPRYRLMKLIDCAPGTRFYFYRLKELKPFTLITKSKRSFQAIYHNGHEYDAVAKRYRTSLQKSVWAKVEL